MKKSLDGIHLLPESKDDAQQIALDAAQQFRNCCGCGIPLHDPAAAHSPAGWRETQISGMCESCFDSLLGDDEELNDHG